MDQLIWQLVLQLVLIALNAFFACAEIAGLSVNDAKIEQLKEKGDKRAASLEKLTSAPSKFLSTIQVAITLSGFLGSAFAADNFSYLIQDKLMEWFPSVPLGVLDSMSVISVTLILSYLTLIFGELVPKRVAMKKAESIALSIAGTICFVAAIFKPVVWILEKSTNGILRLLGIDPHEVTDDVSEEEIRLMVEEGSKTGAIDSEEKEIIHNLFEFDDKTVGEFYTHRTDLEFISTEDDVSTWEDTIFNSYHSMYPVCTDTIDNVVGVLITKKFYRLKTNDKETIQKEAIEPAFFIPETMKADVAFKLMKQKRKSFAIVLDEYGGVAGIVTIKDIISQIVGDYDTEDDEISVPDIQQMGENEYLIQGIASLDEVAKELNVDLPLEEYDTFGGYVFGILGSIPDDGSQIECSDGTITVRSNNIEAHRLISATVSVNALNDINDESNQS